MRNSKTWPLKIRVITFNLKYFFFLVMCCLIIFENPRRIYCFNLKPWYLSLKILIIYVLKTITWHKHARLLSIKWVCWNGSNCPDLLGLYIFFYLKLEFVFFNCCLFYLGLFLFFSLNCIFLGFFYQI
jgi:hypothetical protein